MQHRRTILLSAAAIILIVGPAAADPWYEYYANAQQALVDEALQENLTLRSAALRVLQA